MTGGQSLRLRLMLWLALPVALVLAGSLWLSWSTARQQAMLIMQRNLTSSTRMIAEQVRYRDGAIRVVVPPAALELFVTDAHDEVAYAVFDPEGVLIAGFPGLDPPPVPPSGGPLGFDTMFRTEAMHAVTLRQPVITPEGTVPVTVAVGETLYARNALVRALWLRGFAEQAALVLAAAVSIWIGITRELRPLLRLRRAVLDRPPQSVEPFDEGSVQAELRPLVAALNTHMARLGAYLDRQQRFLDGAAHQMRTRLAILKTQLGMARRAGEGGETVDRLDREVTGMVRVTNQLLLLGRVEHERARRVIGTVDLRTVAREVVGDVAPRALDAGLDLVLEAEAPCLVRGHARLLREAVTNLIDNAIRHGGPGIVATLTVDCGAAEGTICLRDTGPGVAPADRARLFRRFAEGEGRGAGGSGLGLTLVAEIAELCGGRVTLPETDRGFAVAVVLPRG